MRRRDIGEIDQDKRMVSHKVQKYFAQVLLIFCVSNVARSTDNACTVKEETANCVNKGLFTIPALQPKIKVLFLDGNTLHTLRANSFATARQLRNLSIGNSHVSTLDNDAFGGLTNLSSLNLSHNSISSINDVLFGKHLKKLQYLYLQHNSISRVKQNALDHLINLKELRLDHNKLSSIHPHAFNKLAMITSILIDHNSLKNASRLWFSPVNKTLTRISLGHNPWECDSRMCGFKIWARTVRAKYGGMIAIKCSHPTNKTLKDIHASTICPHNVKEIELNQAFTLSCPDPASKTWKFMTKNRSDHMSPARIESNSRTAITPGKLQLLRAGLQDSGSYCCYDTASDGSRATSEHYHPTSHCTEVKVKAPHSTKSKKSSSGGSGGTIAAVVLLILAAVGGVSFWYLRRKRRNYGLLSDESVFQPSYDDPAERTKIQQTSTDETGLSEAYV